MKSAFLLIGLLVLGAPSRAANAPVHSVPKIEAALKGARGPMGYVAGKVRAHVAEGGGLSLASNARSGKALRLAVQGESGRANLRADQIVDAYSQAAREGKSRREWTQRSEEALLSDHLFLSHGREKALRDIHKDEEPDKVAARQERRLKMRAHLMTKARLEARKLVGKVLPYWERREEVPKAKRLIVREKDMDPPKEGKEAPPRYSKENPPPDSYFDDLWIDE